jgi:S1-C subfamily serine protease
MPDYAFDGEGLRIDGVSENKPAQKAGIIAGDILIKLNEISIKNINQYMQSLAVFKKGDQITVTIIRNGKTISMPITF